MKHRLFRERRRLTVFTVTTTLAAFVLFSGDIGDAYGVKSAAMAAVGTGAAFLTFALALLALSPAMRPALETTGIAALLYILILNRLPELPDIGPEFSTMITAATYFGFLLAAIGTHFLLYGTWLDRLTQRSRVLRTTELSPASRATIFEALLPDPVHTDTYWDKTVKVIQKDPAQPGTLRMAHHYPDGMCKESRVNLLEMTYLKSLRYSSVTVGAQPPHDWRRTVAVVLEPAGDHVVLHIRLEYERSPLRLAIKQWMDDHAGRYADRMLGDLPDEGAVDPVEELAPRRSRRDHSAKAETV